MSRSKFLADFDVITGPSAPPVAPASLAPAALDEAARRDRPASQPKPSEPGLSIPAEPEAARAPDRAAPQA